MSALSGLGYLTSGLTQGVGQGMQYNAQQKQLGIENAMRRQQLGMTEEQIAEDKRTHDLGHLHDQLKAMEDGPNGINTPEFKTRSPKFQADMQAKHAAVYKAYASALGIPVDEGASVPTPPGEAPGQLVNAPAGPTQPPAPSQYGDLKNPSIFGDNSQPEAPSPPSYGNPSSPDVPPTPHDTAVMMNGMLGPASVPGNPVFHSQAGGGVQQPVGGFTAQPAQRPTTPPAQTSVDTTNNNVFHTLGRTITTAMGLNPDDPQVQAALARQWLGSTGALAEQNKAGGEADLARAGAETDRGLLVPRERLTNAQAGQAGAEAAHTRAETVEIPANSAAMRHSQNAGAYASVTNANTGATAEKHNYNIEGQRVGIAGRAQGLAETAEDHRWRQQVDEATQRYQQILTSSAAAGAKQDAQNKLIALNAAKGMYFNKDQNTGALTPSPKATRDAADQILRAVGISFGGNPAASIPPGVDPQMWQISAGGPASINAFMKDPKRSAAQKQALKFAIGVRQKQSRMPAPSAADIFGAGSSPQPENNSQQ